MGKSRHLSRRDFLGKTTGIAAGVAGAMTLGTRRARGYGEVPDGSAGVMLPAEMQVDNVLELFLFGGISQYESFYAIEQHGAADGTGYHLHLQSGELDTAIQACGFSGENLETFAVDSGGDEVKFGPFAAPLRARPDILDRTRLLVTSHEAFPHEVAVPLALTGRPLSSVHMAGLGTHIQRYFMQRDGSSDTPSSYVLLPSDDVVVELGRAAFATGTHPAPSRPLPLLIDRSAELLGLLQRPAVGNEQAGFDALVSANFERYSAQLKHPTAGIVRANAFEDARFAANAVTQAAKLAAVLDPELLAAVPGTSCGTDVPIDTTGMSLKLAAHLLNSEEAKARYVCAFDAGVVGTSDAGGYDTHSNNCATQARNLTRAMDALASIINAPGENDPGKLDLDRTLVIVNTEFGRTPYGEGMGGRGHWPHSFPVLMIGGPASRGIQGTTGADSMAIDHVTPAEHRIAALLALGVWPFAQDSFNVADVQYQGGTNERGAVGQVIEKVFAI